MRTTIAEKRLIAEKTGVERRKVLIFRLNLRFFALQTARPPKTAAYFRPSLERFLSFPTEEVMKLSTAVI